MKTLLSVLNVAALVFIVSAADTDTSESEKPGLDVIGDAAKNLEKAVPRCKSDSDCGEGMHCYRPGHKTAAVCIPLGTLGAANPMYKKESECTDKNDVAKALAKIQGLEIGCNALLAKPDACSNGPMAPLIRNTCCATCKKIAPLAKAASSSILSPSSASDLWDKVLSKLTPEQQEMAKSQATKLTPEQEAKLLDMAEKLGGGFDNMPTLPSDGNVTPEQKQKLVDGLASLQDAFQGHLNRLSDQEKADLIPNMDPDKMKSVLDKLRSALNNDGDKGSEHKVGSIDADQLDDVADALGSLRANCDSEKGKQCVQSFTSDSSCDFTKGVAAECLPYGVCAFEACQKMLDCDSKEAEKCADDYEEKGCTFMQGPSSLPVSCRKYSACVLARCVDTDKRSRDQDGKLPGENMEGTTPWWSESTAKKEDKEKKEVVVKPTSEGGGFTKTVMTIFGTLCVVGVIGFFGYACFRVCTKKNAMGDYDYEGHGLRQGYSLNSGGLGEDGLDVEDGYVPPTSSQSEFTAL
eukprot:g967.t1